MSLGPAEKKEPIGVAGHKFRSLVPGERCITPNCEGMSVIEDLMDTAEICREFQKGVAHIGTLTPTEVNDLREKAKIYRENCDRIFRFTCGRGAQSS